MLYHASAQGVDERMINVHYYHGDYPARYSLQCTYYTTFPMVYHNTANGKYSEMAARHLCVWEARGRPGRGGGGGGIKREEGGGVEGASQAVKSSVYYYKASSSDSD